MGVDSNQLIGTWKTDPSIEGEAQSYENATLEFGSDGTLLYTIHEGINDQVIRLTFRVEHGFIITDQPSHPHLERTAFDFTSDGKLVLSFSGHQSSYVRHK
jgi:hypothetical protein